MLEINQFYLGGGTDQFYGGELGSSTKLALGEKNEWNREKTLGTLEQKKSHKQGKKGMNMYCVFRK